MSTNDNSCCPVWPSIAPYNGGPFPTRLWSRAVPNCVLGFTQEQLDMRRKAEILQYNKNGGHLTKKQQWSRAMRGHGPVRRKGWATQSQDYTDPNTSNLPLVGYTLDCSGGDRPCNPVGASDVPGSGVLCLDRNVPVTGLVVQRQYLAGGTTWPQTTTGDLIVQQYASCPTSDPATWLDISYPPELAPAGDGSVSTNVMTVCAGDYDYLCVILGRKTTTDVSTNSSPVAVAPSYTATVKVLTGEVDEFGAIALGGGGAGGSYLTGTGSGGAGGAGGASGAGIFQPSSGTMNGRTITVQVGQGGRPYNDFGGVAGKGGTTSVSVSDSSWSIVTTGGDGGNSTSFPQSPASGGDFEITYDDGGYHSASQTGGDGGYYDVNGPRPGYNDPTPASADGWPPATVPDSVWQATAVNRLGYTDLAGAPFGGGGWQGAISNRVAVNNNINAGSSLDAAGNTIRPLMSGTVTPSAFGTQSGSDLATWGAGGNGAYDSTIARGGGIGGNGLVILWFRHESPCN